jgi:photosystem II stability/assembly factor-like uncharacterized protein
MRSAQGRKRRPRAVAPAVVLAALLLAFAAVTGGCGGSGTEAPEHPFGEPPAPAPGVHAWAAGEPGVLLVTADGGATWKRQRFLLPQRGVDVAFTDVRTGWLVTDAGTVLASADGGATWSVVEQVKLDVKAIAATDARHAWLVGNAFGAAGEPGASAVFRTTDGGATWKRTGFGMAQLADVAFADDRHGWLVALDRVWSTRDGGRIWTLRRQLGMTVLTGVTAGDARHAYAAGWGTLDGAPFVLTTDDGGATWTRRPVGLDAPVAGALQSRQIACFGPELVWMTCATGVMASEDAGRTWTLQTPPAGEPLGIAAADADHLLATTSGQPILASTDGGVAWRAYGKDGFLEQGLVAISAVRATAAE